MKQNAEKQSKNRGMSRAKKRARGDTIGALYFWVLQYSSSW